MRILVVEDGPDQLDLLTRLLQSAGHEVWYAATGEGALVQLAAHPVDVAVVDLVLPTMDGWRLADTLRADPRYHNLPLVIASGVSREELAEEAGRVGAVALQKPYRVDELERALALAVGG